MNRRSKKIFIKAKRIIKIIKKLYMMIVISFFIIFYNIIPALAATTTDTGSGGGKFEDSIFAKGTKNLFTDIGKYLIILAPIAGAAVGVYFFIRRGAADEMDQKKWNDRIKTTVVSTLGAVLIGTLIVLIASYYGKSITTGIE